MAKKGDTVRYLNAVGGGVVTRIEGKIAYVNDNGFENPVLLSELVVTMPAEMKNIPDKGPNLMFNQQAFDSGKKTDILAAKAPSATAPKSPAKPSKNPTGEINISLFFEPHDIKRLSETTFSAVLLNDSTYRLLFSFAARRDEDQTWHNVYSGDVNADEIITLSQFAHADLLDYEHISFQCIAFSDEADYPLKSPLAVARRLDLTKFHKLHCFRPSPDFDTPVMEIPLVVKSQPQRSIAVQIGGDGNNIHSHHSDNTSEAMKLKKELGKKYRVNPERKQTASKPEDNPHKLLPLIEVDLHISELTDSIQGLTNKDMLDIQLETVKRTMAKHKRRIGQKIVFIHGKGEGVLRRAVLDYIKKDFPKAQIQDASFQEYGFGASLITIH